MKTSQAGFGGSFFVSGGKMTNEKQASQSLGKALQAATINNRSLASVVLTAFVFALFAVPSAFAAGASQIVLSGTTPPPESSSSIGGSSSQLVTTPPIINESTLDIGALLC